MIRYLVVNFGCGNGPLLRAVDLALAVRERLTAVQPDVTYRILVPHVYGDRLPRLLREDFSAELEKDPGLFVLDAALGKLLDALLYDGRDFTITLERLARRYPEIQRAVDAHLAERIAGITLDGVSVTVAPDELFLSVSRNPNVRMGRIRSFYTSIGYLERILRQSLDESQFRRYDADLLAAAADNARTAEDGQDIYFQPEPSVFSWIPDGAPFRPEERRTPPLFHPPAPVTEGELAPGVYVLVSGIPHLGRLYRHVAAQGWRLYVNQEIPEIPNAVRLHPKYVAHPAIQSVVARAAWNTIWLANLSRKPLACPEFLEDDFPEIYYNNRTVEALELGAIWRQGADPAEAIASAQRLQPAIDARYAALRERFGTLDGIGYAASQIADAVLA
ncbi:hypothetical protein EPO33_02650 [Patescibacteria group bacterium]|nr:MAG: hypothetical protein EPO33_02650 [Patescibacteria group bacterium]